VITLIWIIAFLAVTTAIAYLRLSLIISSVVLVGFLLAATFFSRLGVFGLTVLWIVFLGVLLPLNVLPLRRLISKRILKVYQRSMPTMSRTEREALEAGTVGWDGELFSGKPNWSKLFNYPAPKLTAEEQAFLDGPVEELCRMTDDWDITHNRADMPLALWQFIKDNGFFGIIIPKKFGGKEFSGVAHSSIISKLSGRSVTVATTVSVPNSLGPAELLMHYGTEEQKNYYLPRLARGDEIPCFALTGPQAGSDASAMPDYGVVCRQMLNGVDTLGMRLNFNKRYITLAPVATVIGLAFKLYDPEHLLGDKEDLGITCALIPRNTAGVSIGRRHFPLNCAFLNGPIHGKDVFIPIDWVIGGVKMVGHGWRMLMECLATGRAISLPSTVMGGAKVSAFATGAYARIRRQFGTPIGRFEGVEEALTRIAGYTYLIDATRLLTVSMVDRGEKPAVLSGICKYHCTELGRKVSNDAMDVHGGKGICLGPRNYIGRGYEEMPIAITVEGANILTRSLIIFGQGAIRCHPYIFTEMQAAKDSDEKQGLKDFDKALFGHLGFIISNKARSFILALTNGRFTKAPHEVNKRYYQHIARFSASFAYVADVAMLLLGGELKRREKLSGRLGDVLSMLYLASAALKHYEDQGKPEEDLPLVKWACQYALFTAQHQLDEILKNFPNKWIAAAVRIVVFPLGKRLGEPSDKLGHQVATLMLSATGTRQRLTEGTYVAPDKNNPIGLMDQSLELIIATEDLYRRLRKARVEKVIKGYTFTERVKQAVEKNILTAEEATQITAAQVARLEVYAVDDFTFEELERGCH
jgi:acyl-CoA dehydrogenase